VRPAAIQSRPALPERLYNGVMEKDRYFTKEFKDAIVVAGNRARLETLRAGVPVFYWDWNQKLDIMEQRMAASSKYVSSPARHAKATTGNP